MSGLDWGLELVLVGLLAIVLLHAIRLERAVTALRRDRGALGEVVAGFDVSTRAAQAGLGKLRHMTTEAGAEIEGRVAAAAALRDDLTYLMERGGQVADRLETLVRAGRGATSLRMEGARGADARGADARGADARGADARGADARGADARGAAGAAKPVRSSAERNLVAMLQVARAERGRP